MFFPI